MFTLVSRLPTRELLYRQAPTLFGALAIAEIFYKWHSFLLEAAGFLLTWFVLDAVFGIIGRAIGVTPAADAATAALAFHRSRRGESLESRLLGRFPVRPNEAEQ